MYKSPLKLIYEILLNKHNDLEDNGITPIL